MALRPLLVDVIGRITTPSYMERVARVYIFDAWENTPGFVIVYTARAGKPFIRDRAEITSYTKALKPRRDPYLLTTSTGEQWMINKEGCGCGNPIRRTTIRQALDDYSKQMVGG